MELKLNSNSSAGAAADSNMQPIVIPSADIAVNPLLYAVRCMDEGFVHSISEETCPFCDKEKIMSGLFVQIKTHGICCCEKCYLEADGFDKWFIETEKILPSIPKQLDWFIEMYFKGYTPSEAVETMRSVV